MSSSTFISTEQLAQHDGSDTSKPLYLAVRGVVYDMSPGREFYGPGGPYQVFAGKECARALALMQISASECSGNLEGLDAKAIKILDDWDAKFRKKYSVVGQIKDTPSSTESAQSTPATEPEAAGVQSAGAAIRVSWLKRAILPLVIVVAAILAATLL
ncbi:MAG: hypothetical protein WDW36_003887 [Sanguina aurantia]